MFSCPPALSAGKTVAAINDIVRAAATSKDAYPLFAYCAPYRSQAKSVAWDYLKHYSRPIAAETNESELTVRLKGNGAQIRLFGADNADAMRGLGFSGIFMDEYGDFRPSVFGNVIRPALSDKQGWAVFAGTPKGKNQFWEIKQTAERLKDEWFLMVLKASDSGILPASELSAARAQLLEDQFLQEYECSFEAAILGAYYGKEMRQIERQITTVPYQPDLPVHTAWDLGFRDDTAIWFYQVCGGEIHVIDFYAVSGASITEIAALIKSKPYRYGKHNLPHDARAKTLASGGKSIVEQLAEFLGLSTLNVVPDLGVQDGIQAVRRMLPRCYFDVDKCGDGIEALRQYQREWDEDKKAFRERPKHDWCFTGDTQVLTRYGTHQIMNLPYSGEVLTSCGWKQYINPRVTMKNAQLVEVVFKGGYSVRCTPDHLFKTESGWISAESLTNGSVIQSSLTSLRSISMAVYTVYGLAKSIYLGVVKSSIEMFGRMHLAKYLTDAISITKMGIQKTIQFLILSAYRQRYICLENGIRGQKMELATLQEKPQKNGIDRKKEGYGINAMRKGLRGGQSGSVRVKIAHNVTVYLKPLLEKAGILKFTAHLLANLRHIGNAAQIKRRQLVIDRVNDLNCCEDVWCLTVPDAQEFSLRNGAIVHNCSHPADAFRMLAVAWQLEPTAQKSAEPKVLMVGPQNQVTLDDMWHVHSQQISHRARI